MVSADNGTRLKIMLVDDDPVRGQWVESCLGELGFDITCVVDDSMRMLKLISEQAPDVIIIDMASPGRDLLESLSILSQHQPTPVVMFSEEENPEYISRAVDAGVSTYLVGGIDPDKVKPIIEVAFAQFRSFQDLRNALAETRMELSQTRDVDTAKRILMKGGEMSEAQAYEYLRRQAMECGARIPEIAQRIVAQQQARGIK